MSMEDSIILLDISSLKDCTLMCFEFGKKAFTATLYDQYLSVTTALGVPYLMALLKSLKVCDELL